jgi:hypothetical protein
MTRRPLHAAPLPVRRRAPGIRQWVLFAMPDHAGYYFLDPSGRSAAGTGALMYADRVVPVVSVDSGLEFYDGGRRLRRGWFRLDDAEDVRRGYEVEDFGWVYCQGCGYFGGFDDGLGQGVYRGELHSEARCGTSATRRGSSPPTAARSSSSPRGRRASRPSAPVTPPGGRGGRGRAGGGGRRQVSGLRPGEEVSGFCHGSFAETPAPTRTSWCPSRPD